MPVLFVRGLLIAAVQLLCAALQGNMQDLQARQSEHIRTMRTFLDMCVLSDVCNCLQIELDVCVVVVVSICRNPLRNLFPLLDAGHYILTALACHGQLQNIRRKH